MDNLGTVEVGEISYYCSRKHHFERELTEGQALHVPKTHTV